MHDLSKQILAGIPANPVSLIPCTVTAVSPLVVEVSGTSMAGVALVGCTYSLGHAVALWSPPSAPIIFPVL